MINVVLLPLSKKEGVGMTCYAEAPSREQSQYQVPDRNALTPKPDFQDASEIYPKPALVALRPA